jgi:hypothetical protein
MPFAKWLAWQLVELAALAVVLTLAADWLGGLTGWWSPFLGCWAASGLLSVAALSEAGAFLLVTVGVVLAALGLRMAGALLLLAGLAMALAGPLGSEFFGAAAC